MGSEMCIRDSLWSDEGKPIDSNVDSESEADKEDESNTVSKEEAEDDS